MTEPSRVDGLLTTAAVAIVLHEVAAGLRALAATVDRLVDVLTTEEKQ